jgi:hypothetical protein
LFHTLPTADYRVFLGLSLTLKLAGLEGRSMRAGPV